MPEEKSLVMELLQDCKAKDKRNFIIIVVLIVFGFLRRGWFYEDIAAELNCCKDKIGRTARSVKKKIMKVI